MKKHIFLLIKAIIYAKVFAMFFLFSLITIFSPYDNGIVILNYNSMGEMWFEVIYISILLPIALTFGIMDLLAIRREIWVDEE